jgi:asparagine synthase (glutamine-hydrolysing)
MCGIAGFIGPAPASTIRRMLAEIAQRGPDDDGLYTDDRVTLGHKRLSIIDLSAAGRQPMANARADVRLIYNGEIYNFTALRRELAQRYMFRTATDSEVILAAYDVWGRDTFLDHLDGMFAFALWDARDATLLLARDRLGIKPLYWARVASGIAFASEVRALLRHPDVPARLDLARLPEYLMLRYVHSPATALAGVEKLAPGHVLVAKDSDVRIRRYWSADFTTRLHDADAAAAAIRESIHEAVRTHLVADVPVGIMLSGGLDSSVIAACAAEHGADLKTFSIGFAGEADSELPAAAALAERLGSTHREITVAPAHVALLPEIVFANDEPVAGPSSIAYSLALAEARKHAKVILFGHGADEILSGYEQLRLLRLRRRLARIPGASLAARAAAHAAASLFPGDAAFRRLARFVDAGDEAASYFLLTAVSGPDEVRALLQSPGVVDMPAPIAKAFSAERDPETAAIRFEQAGWLPDDILHRVDRMTMAHSLEGRVPFLDRAVVECANGIAPDLKLRGGEEKFILRAAFRSLLPPEILRRRKQRFNIPIDRFFGPAYDRMLGALFTGDHQLTRHVFDRRALAELLRFHERVSYRWILSRQKLAAQFYARQLWTITVYMLWALTVVERRDPAELASGWS